ncbi:MAG: acs [Microbacteriaceae bacterium]|nr:acs [Microbacteriaceae bacterium]
MSENSIDSLLHEDRRFPPSEAFTANAIAKPGLYEEAKADRLAFWAKQSRDLLHWHKDFTQTLDWSQAPFASWFADGELNVAYNCLDRHVEAGNGDRVALYWEGEPGDSRAITYAELTAEVKRAANLFTKLGVGSGDRVAVYLPMIPEAVVTMLAIARIGAIHSVIFGGFSAESIRSRIDDAGAKLVVTADGGWRKGKVSALKPAVDAALAKEGDLTVEHVLVVKRGENEVEWTDRDLWWHEEIASVEAEHVAQPFPAEHPLFILYTSGTTGKPKGILHTSGGYLTQTAFTHRNVFDLHPETDVYWCTADVGWITGHSYIVYGPLSMGVTQVMYEGAPNQPDFGRFWQIIEENGVTIFYTAPTAIRAFIKAGDEFPAKYDLSSLRILGSVGEPINPEAWMWYHEKIGGGRCPIVDTWWQTETGAIMITPLPGCTPLKPGTATLPFFGVDAAILDEEGKECKANEGGRLVIRKPWPSMTRTIYGDKARFKKTYFSDYPGIYTAGDGARRDKQGNFWIVGRLDDVLNVSGHRLGTAEIESALVAHPTVAEAAVVGRPDDLKGQAVVAFVTLKGGIEGTPALQKELRDHIAKIIGAIARPDDLHFAPALPKTRSGKIMRRLLKELVATGSVTGNTSTLEDHGVIESLQKKIRGEN